jgi:Something about silencing, SAS, complex subunit 4
MTDYVKPDEPIYIVNESLKEPQSISVPTKNASQSRFKSIQSSTSRNQYETIDLASLAPLSIGPSRQDPLDDSVYLKAHRRSERREKQLRNIEKERAQHEKGQLESLLDSLQGPDWLRAMGVTGITDGARKEWEPKRDYFIREVRALLRKFARWRDAEKRLLLEKENVQHAKDDEQEEEEEEYEEEGEADLIVEEYEDDDSTLNGPASSDVDAWAAHQLLQEAKSASQSSQFRSSKPRPPPKPPKPPKPLGPPKPFVSFFFKSHERAAALGKGRQSARRTSLAFGHSIPEFSDVEFKLPEEYITPEALMAHARKRRRLNREKKEDDPE